MSVLVAFMLYGTPAQGQGEVPTGRIVGTVTDPTGAVISTATVTATNVGTSIANTVQADTAGNYTIPLLQVGTYSVAVQTPGFARFVATSVGLSAGATVRVDAKMQVGQTAETVDVSDTAPLLQTDTATMSTTLVPAQVENLPLNGRNFIELVRTAPGVNEGGMTSLGSGTRPDDRRQSSTLSANGQPDFVNNYEIDGMDNNERMIGTIGVRPSVDAIQEVNVQTNLYTSNQTRTAGAVVNIITKSGTNKFHGSAYEFLRNDIFDAKDYFNQPAEGNPLAGKKPEYRQNQFGGSIGGPIIKNKTFFFVDYEDLRIVQGIATSTNVPSPCELGAVACNGYQGLGNFSDLLPAGTVIYNPVTQQPYSYNGHANVIPPSLINPISAEYAQLFPTNSSCATPSTCLFNDSPNRTQFASTFDTRIDQHFTDKTYLYGRFSFNNENTFTPGALPAVNVTTAAGNTIKVQPGEEPGAYSFPGPNNERTQNLALSLTHTFSQHLVGQLTGSYVRIHILSQPLDAGGNVNNAFGGPPVNNNAAANEAGTGLAPVAITGYGQLGSDQYIPLEYLDNIFQYSGNMILTRGNHNINFGAGVIRRQSLLAQSPDPLGLFTFTGLLTNSNEGNPLASGGNSFAQFLSGYMDNANRQLQLNVPNTRSWETSAYIEDDWRATPFLTLNLGLRYDIFTPFTETHNYMSNFDPTVPSVLNRGQVIIAGQGGWGPTAGVVTDHKDFSPRIGFAATIPHSMVVRGGFGMSYFPTNFFTGAPLPNQPFESVSVIQSQFGHSPSDNYVPPQFGQSLGPAAPTSTCLTNACQMAMTGQPFPAGTITAVYQPEAFNYKPAYAYQYSLEVQKAIAGSTLTLGYVGSIDHRLQTTFNLDAPLPPLGPGGCGATYAISLPDTGPLHCQPYYNQLPLTSGLFENMSTGEAKYNGVQIDFRHTGSRGLTFDTNYSYGRNLTNASTGSGGGLYGLIPGDTKYDWGNGMLDMRHRWTGTLSYDLPFGKSLTGFAGGAAKGWSVNTLIIWASGLPTTVVNGAAPQINNGSNPDRPNVVGPLYPKQQSLNEWFNIAAFALQPFGTAGNEHNNQIYGPSGKSVALSLFKNFPIREDTALQFRVEAFNLFNTPVFAEPNTTINAFGTNNVPTNAGQFGAITQTNSNFPARQIQLALKLLF